MGKLIVFALLLCGCASRSYQCPDGDLFYNCYRKLSVICEGNYSVKKINMETRVVTYECEDKHEN